MIHVFRARRVLCESDNPASCLENACLVCDVDEHGQPGDILDIGSFEQVQQAYPKENVNFVDLGDVTVVPGLVNCHAHLELSHVLGKTTQGQGFCNWVASLVSQSLQDIDSETLTLAVQSLVQNGVVVVADYTSRCPELVAETLDHAGVDFCLFFEFFGYAPLRTTSTARDAITSWSSPAMGGNTLSSTFNERLSAAGHALYSTKPETLRYAKDWCVENNRPYSLHLSEHKDEIELLQTGGGDFAALLKKRVIPKDYDPPALSPVAYAHKLGLLDERTLAIHCVQLSKEDIDILRATQVNVCLCPRSNEFIGVGSAPVLELKDAGVTICLGTDSLASNHDLNLWNEARCLLEQWPELELLDVLPWMTIHGARALGVDAKYGTLEKGKSARFTVLPQDLDPFL